MCAACAEGLEKYFGSETKEFQDFVLWNKTAFPFSHGEHTALQLRQYRGAMLQGKDVCESCGSVKSLKHLISGNCRMCDKRASVGYERGFRPTTRRIRVHRNQFNAEVMLSRKSGS